MREIPITDLPNVWIGHADDEDGGTGCTVILTERGAVAGLDIRGGGPATRETALLKPTASAQTIHAVLLAGGSAFGLGSADGVMAFLAERNIGVDVGVARVPLVVQADIFDLDFQSHDVYPDATMAYQACKDAHQRAEKGTTLAQGCVGVGTGATIGKAMGPGSAMKSGLGHYAVSVGGIRVGALAVCNAIGDVFDIDTGAQLGGLRDEGGAFCSTEEFFYQALEGAVPAPTAGVNTTLGVVLTDVALDKTSATKLAMMAQNGLARTICPVHTSFDGDAVFALSVGNITAPDVALDGLGTLGAYVLGKAINNAVRLA